MGRWGWRACGKMQCGAMADAVHCMCRWRALRWPMQCTASCDGVHCLWPRGGRRGGEAAECQATGKVKTKVVPSACEERAVSRPPN